MQSRFISGVQRHQLQFIETGRIYNNKVKLNNFKRIVHIFVVPDDTMHMSVILGKDHVLNKFNLGLRAS